MQPANLKMHRQREIVRERGGEREDKITYQATLPVCTAPLSP